MTPLSWPVPQPFRPGSVGPCCDLEQLCPPLPVLPCVPHVSPCLPGSFLIPQRENKPTEGFVHPSPFQTWAAKSL